MLKTLDITQKEILNSNYIGKLGYISKQEPCITVIPYFYNEEQHNITCYLTDCEKIDALRNKNAISLSISDINSANNLKSVIVQGTYKEHDGSGAKAILHQLSSGIKKILLNKDLKDSSILNQFSSKGHNNDDVSVIFTIEIDEIISEEM